METTENYLTIHSLTH